MNELKEYLAPTDEFVTNFAKMTFYEWKDTFDTSDDYCGGCWMAMQKRMRNDYDNRMRPRNLILYYAFARLTPDTRSIQTQTD